MTPQENAKELVEKFIAVTRVFDLAKGYVDSVSEAKEAALICVDEIIEECRDFCDTDHHQDRMSYWQKVKEEINKICPECNGRQVEGKTGSEGIPEADVMFVCSECNGTGKILDEG